MSDAKEKSPCCSLAEKVGGRRMVDLDAELCRADHRSFRKLAEAYGIPGQKSAVERHKKGCLRIGMGYEPPPVQDPPRGRPVRVEPVPSVPEVSQGQRAEAGTPTVDPLPARAPVSGKVAISLPERMAYIVSQMTDGTWDSARDIPHCAAMWGLHEDSVRHTARHVTAGRQLNRGDMADREEESLAFYAWQLEDLRRTLAECVEPEERSKVHARMTEVRARMDAILFPRAGATINVNFAEDPKFREAARKFVDTVQDVLASPEAIAARLVEQGTPVPSDVIAAVLAAADVAIAERLRPRPPPTLAEAA